MTDFALNWNQLDSATVSNLFLYGRPVKPGDIVWPDLLRKPDPLKVPGQAAPPGQTGVLIDAVSFMKTGPGRFASASQFKIVNDFMSGSTRLAAKKGERTVFDSTTSRRCFR